MSAAPGFTAGPRFVSGGLLWSAPGGVFVSSPSGARLVASGVSLSDVVGDRGFVAIAERSGVLAGRLGGRLVSVGLLRRCPPVRSAVGSRLLALTGHDLYAVIASRCVRGRGAAGQALVRVGLPRRTVRVLTRVRAGAATIAATGSRLALTYIPRLSLVPDTVDVLDGGDGDLLFTLHIPFVFELGAITTQVDSRGDVLVTGSSFGLLGTSATGFWANRRTRVTGLAGLEVGADPVPFSIAERIGVAASLSNGKLAYATYGSGGRRTERSTERIDVRDLATGVTRTIVRFPGSASVIGITLRGTELAWAQQSIGYTTPVPPPTPTSCPPPAQALGPVELATASIHASTPIIERGEPSRSPVGPLCPPPP